MDRFKFKTIADDETIYTAQKTEVGSKEYYILLWKDETGECDTCIDSYVWEVSKVEENINEGIWIIVS